MTSINTLDFKKKKKKGGGGVCFLLNTLYSSFYCFETSGTKPCNILLQAGSSTKECMACDGIETLSIVNTEVLTRSLMSSVYYYAMSYYK